MDKYQETILNSGTISIFGEIRDNMIKEVIEKILYCSQKDISEITLLINSYGGSTASAFALTDTIALMRNIKIKTIGLGAICSSGLTIFMTGDKRLISDSASILAHQYAWSKEGKHHELVGRRKEEDLIREKSIKHFRKYTKLSRKIIETELLCETDTWLSPKEAIKYNLADEIINSYKI